MNGRRRFWGWWTNGSQDRGPWSTIPKTVAFHSLSGQIQFGNSGRPTGSLTSQGGHIVLPPQPGRSHQYLVAGRKGPNAVALDWLGPGLSVNFQVPKCRSALEVQQDFNRLLCQNLLPYLCDYLDNCENYGSPFPPGEDPCDPFRTGPSGPDGDPTIPPQGDTCDWVSFYNGLLVLHKNGRVPTARTFPGVNMVNGFDYNPCTDTSTEGPDYPDDPDPDDPDSDPDGDPDGGGDGDGDPDGDPNPPDPEPPFQPPHIPPPDGCEFNPLIDTWKDPCVLDQNPPDLDPITDPWEDNDPPGWEPPDDTQPPGPY